MWVIHYYETTLVAKLLLCYTRKTSVLLGTNLVCVLSINFININWLVVEEIDFLSLQKNFSKLKNRYLFSHKTKVLFFIGGDPSAGSPTDTLLQLSPPRETKNRSHHKEANSSKLHSAGLMGGVCKAQGLIHREIMTRDYWGFQLNEGELQPSIRTKAKFKGLPYPFGLGTHCLDHCRPRVAQEIRAIQIYRSPHLPPGFPGSPTRVLLLRREK